MKPLIGIPAERFSSGYGSEPDQLVQGTLATYVDAVLGAGGLPVIIPLSVAAADLHALYTRLDGVLLTGGGDVDPDSFDEAPHPKLGAVDVDRDRLELALARLTVKGDKPVLGVCRGAQVMNVALGGTLFQDLPSQYGGPLVRHAHPVKDFPRQHLAHPVQVTEASLLARVLGAPTARVNSRHHQAIKDVAPGLTVVARAPDGVVEAVERAGHPFALGVQWHPENLQDSPEMKALFVKFVEASAAGRMTKGHGGQAKD
jgi:putative glutamine amidotransferase